MRMSNNVSNIAFPIMSRIKIIVVYRQVQNLPVGSRQTPKQSSIIESHNSAVIYYRYRVLMRARGAVRFLDVIPGFMVNLRREKLILGSSWSV